MQVANRVRAVLVAISNNGVKEYVDIMVDGDLATRLSREDARGLSNSINKILKISERKQDLPVCPQYPDDYHGR